MHSFTLRTCAIVIVYAILYVACNSHSSDSAVSRQVAQSAGTMSPAESGAVPEPAPVVRKLGIFNDIDLLRSKLSENGIGSLCEWRSDEVGGYMSITYYYRFGEPSAKNGMDNNLAYYLESKNKNYMETLSLVLNINNSAAEREAIDRFIQVTKMTFRAIGVDMPKGLVRAIEKKKEFMAEKDLFRTKLLLEESKIETLKLMIFAQ